MDTKPDKQIYILMLVVFTIHLLIHIILINNPICMIKISVLLLLISISLVSCAPSQRPVIGIYTQDTE